jgi:hypothetical protein
MESMTGRFQSLWVFALVFSCMPACQEQPVPQAVRRDKPIVRTARIEPDMRPKRLRFTIEATFSGLPEGSRILAPVPQDWRYQKVLKSDHDQVTGMVLSSGESKNLLFLSQKVSGAVTYRAILEMEGRYVMPGTLDHLEQATYKELRDPRDVKYLKTWTGRHGPPNKSPVPVVTKAFDAVVKAEVTDGFKAARMLSSKLTAQQVPHRLLQGLWIQNDRAIPHAWVVVLLPRIGWAPFDSVAYAQSKAAKPIRAFRGRHPADRIRLRVAESDTVKLPDGGTVTWNGPLAQPMAIKDGQSVGQAKVTVRVERLTQSTKGAKVGK